MATASVLFRVAGTVECACQPCGSQRALLLVSNDLPTSLNILGVNFIPVRVDNITQDLDPDFANYTLVYDKDDIGGVTLAGEDERMLALCCSCTASSVATVYEALEKIIPSDDSLLVITEDNGIDIKLAELAEALCPLLAICISGHFNSFFVAGCGIDFETDEDGITTVAVKLADDSMDCDAEDGISVRVKEGSGIIVGEDGLDLDTDELASLLCGPLQGCIDDNVDPKIAAISLTPGPQGEKGWSPVFAVVTDGARRVLQVSSWAGGAGTPPASGLYVGPSGLTAVLASAVDIRGATGATGATGAGTFVDGACVQTINGTNLHGTLTRFAPVQIYLKPLNTTSTFSVSIPDGNWGPCAASATHYLVAWYGQGQVDDTEYMNKLGTVNGDNTVNYFLDGQGAGVTGTVEVETWVPKGAIALALVNDDPIVGTPRTRAEIVVKGSIS